MASRMITNDVVVIVVVLVVLVVVFVMKKILGPSLAYLRRLRASDRSCIYRAGRPLLRPTVCYFYISR